MRISDWSSDVCSSDLPDKPWRSAGADREVDYALRQRFPLWGKRGLARTAATQDAVAVGLDRITTARDLLSDAEAAYARYWHADQAVAVLDRRIALLRQVEEMAGVRYALRSEEHTSELQSLMRISYAVFCL